MKFLRCAGIVLFAAVLLLPMLFFNFTPDSVSMIDNRKLAENPFTAEGDLTVNVENYLNDRIGFRDEMITAYTVMNDRIFQKMVHPSYSYGKDGSVFGAGITTSNIFGQYHIVFADAVLALQNYCESRNVPFLFVFNPAKPAVYPNQLADGIHYNRVWVDLFLAELDQRNVSYLDTTQLLAELSASGTDCFNVKYDANHWNDTGAFYGTQRMLQKLKERLPSIHVNELSEFNVTEKLQTSLKVSKFPIHEMVPDYQLTLPFDSLNSLYSSEIALHPSYQGFGYYRNPQRLEEGTPKALVFQGSYMNGYGYKFLINAFGEYICVHDYQNVLDLPYYFNIFQPDCVIFEVAEYTFRDDYFSYETMASLDYNPPLSSLSESDYTIVTPEQITIEAGEALSVITWHTDLSGRYVWLELDNVYDMKPVEGGYQVTVENACLDSAAESLRLYVSNS